MLLHYTDYTVEFMLGLRVDLDSRVEGTTALLTISLSIVHVCLLISVETRAGTVGS